MLDLSLTGLGVGSFTEFSGEEVVLRKYISKKNKPIIVDVGAHFGNWSKIALKVNPTAQIYAFEPSAYCFEKLKEISQIKAFNLACGDKAGPAVLYDIPDNTYKVLASLNCSVVKRYDPNPTEEKVSVITLDSFIQKEKISHVDFLKVDVEGFEYDVLLGAKEALASGKIKLIQFEFNAMNVFTKRFFKDFYELLPNFDFYRLLEKGQIPLRKYDNREHEIFDYQNILAVAR